MEECATYATAQLQANAFGARGASSDDGLRLGLAVSMFNHACDANAAVVWRRATRADGMPDPALVIAASYARAMCRRTRSCESPTARDTTRRSRARAHWRQTKRAP